MTDLTNWNFYYNLEGTEDVRANLVYSPLVSPDKKTFCMDFNRDIRYHWKQDENELWNDELLTDRFNRELHFHSKMSSVIPTLKIIDVDYNTRKIFIEWYGDDFYMQGLKSNGYDNVIVDWKEQWTSLIRKMWDMNVYKISLHPNSWVAHDGILIPFNWFFCYNVDDPKITIRSLLMQISTGRQEKLQGIDLDKEYTPKDLQRVAFNSFRSNYPKDLIENILNYGI